MTWHGWETDPTKDPAAPDVLAAYELADAVPPAGPIVLEVLT